MNDSSELDRLVQVWRAAIDEFVALVREVPEDQWDLPTDLEGWSVKDNAAHTAHLESVLAGGPEETIAVEEAPHIKDLSGFYTEQGVLARRERDMASLADEIEQAAAIRVAELAANPPTDGSAAPPRTPGGVPWNPDFEWKYVNYTPLVVGGTLLVLWLAWQIRVKNTWTGPHKTVDLPERLLFPRL